MDGAVSHAGSYAGGGSKQSVEKGRNGSWSAKKCGQEYVGMAVEKVCVFVGMLLLLLLCGSSCTLNEPAPGTFPRSLGPQGRVFVFVFMQAGAGRSIFGIAVEKVFCQ